MSDPTQQKRSIRAANGDERLDAVAIEEPLEIRLGFRLGGREVVKSIAVTMRTPGNDAELAVGFLVGEGLLTDDSTVSRAGPCNDDPTIPGAQNVIRVDVERPDEKALGRLDRNFYTTSSCGVCGKASIDAISVPARDPNPLLRVDAHIIRSLPAALRVRQDTFESTGGIHGAGLFSSDGTAIVVREDVGRHNAVDKALGRLFLDGTLPASDLVLVLSGRASFELVQKALVAGVPVIVAVGAPSTLAIDLAARHGATLVGFARNGGFNVYSGHERVVPGS